MKNLQKQRCCRSVMKNSQYELDHPLFEGFKNGATETLSNIILEEITTDNTFGMQEYVEVPETAGSWYMPEVKAKLTMADFLGLEDVKPEAGIPMLANVEAIGWFTDLFRADYENMGASVESLDQMLEMYLYSGEYSHSEYHPVGNLISGILDVTIIKPFVESIYGKDLITGEKLTDFERGMQFVNAVVGAVTFGQGALALDFSKMTAKEIAVELVKIWGVDAIADASAYTAGYACDELGMPAGVSFLASMLTGCTVSVGVGGYVFTDSSGKVVKELDADEMQTWLKSIDDDLDDMMGGGGYKGGSRSAQGLTGRDFENYLNNTLGGDGSFSVGGREFDGGVGNRWWEAKSGNYWDMLEDNPSMLAKFKSDMGNRLRIATDNGATYELFSNTPVPESIKQWLIEKGISFTELLD